MGFDLLSERSRERQQAALVDVEAAVLVAADDVDGERRSVPGRVFVRHHQLEDAAAERLALLQEDRCVNSPFLFNLKYFTLLYFQFIAGNPAFMKIMEFSFGLNCF